MDLRSNVPTRIVVGALHALLYGAVLWSLPRLLSRSLVTTDVELCGGLLVIQFMWAQAWLRPGRFLGRTALWGYRPFIDYAFVAALLDIVVVLTAPYVGIYPRSSPNGLAAAFLSAIAVRTWAAHGLAQEIGDLPQDAPEGLASLHNRTDPQ